MVQRYKALQSWLGVILSGSQQHLKWAKVELGDSLAAAPADVCLSAPTPGTAQSGSSAAAAAAAVTADAAAATVDAAAAAAAVAGAAGYDANLACSA